MQVAPLPHNEADRLAALRRLDILDTTPEERYDRLVRLAAAALQTPIALISLVDEGRQWFKARVGLDAAETPRDVAFCTHAIEADHSPFIVNNATVDARFADNPLVTHDPRIVFYAGQVVHDPDGYPMGTLCVIDYVPRSITYEQRQILRDLASIVEYEFAHAERDELVGALEHSERSKTVLLDALTDGMVMMDASGSIVEWNASANTLLGLSDEELSGRSSFDPRWRTIRVDGSPWPPDEHPAIQAIHTGQPVTGTAMGVHRPDGSLVWLRVNSRPVINEHGTTTGSVTLFANVAADFDAERAAEAVALRLRQAVESSGIGTALLDGDGATTFINEAFTDIVGMPFSALLGRPATAWIHPDDPMLNDDPTASFNECSAGNVTKEIRVVRTSGGETWVRAHIARLTDIEESHYVVQLEDITERRALQHTLRRSEQVARASLESLEQGIVVADATGAVHQSNRAAAQILGYDAAELTAQFRSGQWTSYDEHGVPLAPEDRPLRQVIVSGEPVHGALVGWRRKQGDLALLRLSCVPVDTADDVDEPVRFVVAFSDVTDQYRSERLLDATFSTAPVGLAVIDADHLVVRCNPTFADHTGVSGAELVGSAIGDLLGDLEPVSMDDQSADESQERLITREDGTEIWVDTRNAHIGDLDRPLDIIATFDVTERKRMQLDLQRFEHLFQSANDIITVVDDTGQVLYASPSNERVMGYPDGWRSPGGVLDLVHPDDLEESAARFIELLRGDRGDEPFTMRLRTFDGRWRSIETIGTNLLAEPSVRGIVLTSRDVTERQLLTDELAYRATHDVLTDLPNRAAAEDRLTVALARARREQRRVGVCFLDLDHFKSVNDTLGHAAGDSVLVEVAERLNRVVRESDLPARLGGDEFIIVLDLVEDLDQAMIAAKRIHDRLTIPPITVGGLTVPASMGVAISTPEDSTSTLLSRADAALYDAKRLGNSGISSRSHATGPLPG